MAKSYLKTSVLAGVLLLGLHGQGLAGMAVTDATAIAKATEQLNKMKEQLDKLNEVKKQIDEQLKTIGSYGKLTLPFFNTLKMANQLKRDAQCLMPDWKQLIPSLNFEDVGFSLCDRSSFYRNSLWVDPIKINGRPVIDPKTGEIKNPGNLGDDWSQIPGGPGGSTWSDPDLGWGKFPDNTASHESIRRYRENLSRRQEEVEHLRQTIYEDAISNALAIADKEAADSESRSKDIDDAQQQTADAKDQREQLASIGQSNIQIARLLNKLNQNLTVLTKVQAAYALKAGVPINKLPAPATEGLEDLGKDQ